MYTTREHANIYIRKQEAVHKMGCPRVATDIRIGTRIDKDSSNKHKKSSVERYLAQEQNKDSTA